MKTIYLLLIVLLMLSLKTYSSYSKEYINEFASAPLVLSLSKEKYKYQETIKSHFYLLFSDGETEIPHGVIHEAPETFGHPSGGYTRFYLECYKILKHGAEKCKYKLDNVETIKKIVKNEGNQHECDINKLFELKPGRYKIRLLIERVDAIEEFIKLPKPRDENGNDIEETEPSESEKKDLERRRTEALKKPRKTEIIKASEWIEFEVVE